MLSFKIQKNFVEYLTLQFAFNIQLFQLLENNFHKFHSAKGIRWNAQ